LQSQERDALGKGRGRGKNRGRKTLPEERSRRPKKNKKNIGGGKKETAAPQGKKNAFLERQESENQFWWGQGEKETQKGLGQIWLRQGKKEFFWIRRKICSVTWPRSKQRAAEKRMSATFFWKRKKMGEGGAYI